MRLQFFNSAVIANSKLDYLTQTPLVNDSRYILRNLNLGKYTRLLSIMQAKLSQFEKELKTPGACAIHVSGRIFKGFRNSVLRLSRTFERRDIS